MTKNPENQRICPICGGPGYDSKGVCAGCLLGAQMMNSTANQTIDFAVPPLIENPEQDLSIDESGHAQWHGPFVPGSRVGQFEIVKRLGRGGMGTVYEAEDIENQRRVALKVLSRRVDDQDARQRFLREGRLAASINHPNSVFVFGTHQVDRWSLISMELVDGGTIEQQVRQQGPMKSRVAVDAAIQLIDGLQAAYSMGVLHRDIKPANCFQGTDGIIKIGDFGLSISMDIQPSSRITSEGLFLGTPAYSSPEQLRGDALDVRSDIYALGVTLFYMLTGQTPFKADGIVKLLALVLESMPPSAHAICHDIPIELSQIVARCLSKEPGDRFRNYSDLRAALARFSSAVAEPASLGPRAIAGVIDDVVLFAFSILCSSPLLFIPLDPSNNLVTHVAYIVYLAVSTFYFATCEATFGQTIGKLAMGLHTIDAQGNRPTILLALRRAAIYLLVPVSILLPFNLAWEHPSTLQPRLQDWLLLAIVESTSWILWAILFLRLNPVNRQIVLLDFLSETRVVSKMPESRRVMDVSQPISTSLTVNRKNIGPYYILEMLSTNSATKMFVGYDTILLRRVWLRENDDLADFESSRYRSSLARATRLRWLNHLMVDGSRWDVYEAPSGQPFMNRLLQPTCWKEIKYCLADLITELSSALKTDTLPKQLKLDHVWVTESGHVKLLDFAAPQIEESPDNEASESRAGVSTKLEITPEGQVNHFLAVLASRLDQALTPRNGLTLPPPLSVSNMIQRLKTPGDLNPKMQAVTEITSRHEMAPRKRRLLMAISCYAAPLLVLILAATFQLNTWFFFRNNPDIAELYCLGSMLVETEAYSELKTFDNSLNSSTQTPHERQTPFLEKYCRYHSAKTVVASGESELLKDPRLQSLALIVSFSPFMIGELEAAASVDKPSPAELDAAKKLLKDDLAARLSQIGSLQSFVARLPIQMAIGAWWIYVCVPATIAAILFRGGLVMHGFQVAVVRMNGTRVGRLGVFVRSLFPHIPCIVALACVTPVTIAPTAGSQSPSLHPFLAFIAFVVLVLLAVVSNLVGLRSLTDRLLGTAVVSK